MAATSFAMAVAGSASSFASLKKMDSVEFAVSEGGGIGREIRGEEEAEKPSVECVCAQCSARIGGDGIRFAREPAFR